MWRELLAIEMDGKDDEPIATYSAIENALTRVLRRVRENDLILSDVNFIKQVIRILPIYSTDLDAKDKAIDDLIIEAAEEVQDKKKNKQVARKKPHATRLKTS